MTRYAMTVEYRGTDFHGFQKQPRLSTIQGALESALTTFTGREIRVQGAGRTDAGVHAVGQTAAFDAPGDIEVERVARGVNALLPEGVAVTRIKAVGDDFDPRREATWREYRYFMLARLAPSPLLEQYTYHLPRDSDRGLMDRACALFPGEHDFSAFKAKSEDESSVRTVLRCELVDAVQDILCLVVRANSFLYRMVRVIGGAVVAVGRGRMSIEELGTHLQGGPGPCADPLPAKGLFFWRVAYPPDLPGQ